MTSSASGVAVPRPGASVVPWTAPLLRAAPAIAAAIVITFTGGHSAQFGLAVFAGWAGLTAVADVVVSRMLPAGLPRMASVGRAIAGALGAAITGLTALGVLGDFDEVTRTAALALTAAATLMVCGIIDAGVGVRTKGPDAKRPTAATAGAPAGDAFSRDWTTAGVIQVLAAIAILIVSPSLEHRYEVEGVSGVITGAIVVIGILGLAAAILGVLLAIAGFSLRGGRRAGGAAVEVDADAPEGAADAAADDAVLDDAAPAGSVLEGAALEDGADGNDENGGSGTR